MTWSPPFRSIFFFGTLAWLLVFLVALPIVAFAQEAATVAANTRISLAPFFDYIFNVLAAVLPPVLTALAVWAARKWFNVKLEDTSRLVLQSALERGTSMALSKARQQAKKVEDVNLHNELAATVAQYALARTPDAVARFGITPAELKEMALARLEERLNPQAAVPAPAPAPKPAPAPTS